jgi:ABC-type branched-subunit amino acid transport system ATPase component
MARDVEAAQPGIDAQGLSVAYGGLRALSAATFSAPLATITGLIGPNGAGKTTTFNALTGLVTPTGGTVRLLGEIVTNRSPAHRARKGLGRTFQRMELVNAMPVHTNVLIGAECRLVGSRPWRQLVTNRAERRGLEEATQEALEICGIADLTDRTVATLSTGQRRLVELARVVAGRFRMLLLDEPSSGLDEDETGRFGEILTTVVRERGIGILLVEHDMTLVMSICDYIYVLDFGELIFEGTVAETQNSDLVRAAYLGSELVEERSA